MVKKAALSRLPQRKVDDEKAVSFITDAGKTDADTHPWETANDRVMKAINLRLPEPTWAKLRYIADHTPFSIQKFVMYHLEPAIEGAIKELME